MISVNQGHILQLYNCQLGLGLRRGWERLERRVCGMKLRNCRTAQWCRPMLDDTNRGLETDRAEQARMKQVRQLFNCKM
ncbi:MAG: hypothetical protein DME26_13070 [Verrucomicrobia bacterium]|nr:MAG: hypothetical protein DME26_13070 [Verrucomicrobiota bacterium]